MASSNVLTIPNILTFLRMALIPVFAGFLFSGHHGWALVTFIFAGASDGIDGFVARRFDQESELGTILDPIADKLLMTTAFVILSLESIFPPDTRHLPVPPYVAAAVIGRDILIIAAAAAIFMTTNFRGFKPSKLGKLSTLVQVSGVILILIATVFPVNRGLYLPTVYATITALAFFSGVHYVFFVARLMREADNSKNTVES